MSAEDYASTRYEVGRTEGPYHTTGILLLRILAEEEKLHPDGKINADYLVEEVLLNKILFGYKRRIYDIAENPRADLPGEYKYVSSGLRQDLGALSDGGLIRLIHTDKHPDIVLTDEGREVARKTLVIPESEKMLQDLYK